MGEVLWIEDEEQRVLFIVPGDLEGAEGIETDIVVAHTQDKRNDPIQLFIDLFEHEVELIPTVETGTHAIVIDRISAQNDDIWSERS